MNQLNFSIESAVNVIYDFYLLLFRKISSSEHILLILCLEYTPPPLVSMNVASSSLVVQWYMYNPMPNRSWSFPVRYLFCAFPAIMYGITLSSHLVREQKLHPIEFVSVLLDPDCSSTSNAPLISHKSYPLGPPLVGCGWLRVLLVSISQESPKCERARALPSS